MLEQIDDADTVMADGAYDGEPTYQKFNKKNENVTVIIPPPKNPIIGDQKNPQHNVHVNFIKEHGRRAWGKNKSLWIKIAGRVSHATL